MLCATGKPRAAAQGESGAPPAASGGGQAAVQEESSVVAPALPDVVTQKEQAMHNIVFKQYQQIYVDHCHDHSPPSHQIMHATNLHLKCIEIHCDNTHPQTTPR